MLRIVLLLAWLSAYPLVQAEDWPAWRGPRGDGTSAEMNLPIQWTATSNVLWRTTLPGQGHASPIVFGNRVFTVSAVAETQDRVLLCLDRSSGQILWTRTVLTAPFERKHPLNSHASSTPATDGEHVYAAFLDRDQMAVAAYDHQVRRAWLVRPGPFQSMHGLCSSPILYKDKVLVNGDHDGESYLLALSRADGRVLW